MFGRKKLKAPWEPSEVRYVDGVVPPAGSIIPTGDRRLVKVLEVREIDPADWQDVDHAAYDLVNRHRRGPAPARSEWASRPRILVLLLMVAGRETGKAEHWRYQPYAGPRLWPVVPEHYAVCAVCGDPYPCLHIEAEQQARREMEALEPYLARQSGCCWTCGEPVTSRTRKWIEFDGDNVALPTGPSPVVFHLARSKCRAGAILYEEQWVAADPDHRRRRLRCKGSIVVHVDGPDCTEPHCPGPETDHGSFTDHRHHVGDGVPCLRCSDAHARGLG